MSVCMYAWTREAGWRDAEENGCVREPNFCFRCDEGLIEGAGDGCLLPFVVGEPFRAGILENWFMGQCWFRQDEIKAYA